MSDPGATLNEASPHIDSLLALQRAAYTVEALLIGDDRIPPLHEHRADLVLTRLSWFFERDAHGDLVGAIGFRVHDGEVDIDRLVVDPSLHRRGIGRLLVARALALGDRAVVSTGRANAPARRLYESEGFVHQRDREVIVGLWVSDYRWRS